MRTPWGSSQSQNTVAPGLVEVSTAGHGGIHLDAARWKTFREIFPLFKSWAGDGWLEEDCDYTLAVLAFHEHFKPAQIFSAVRGLRNSAPSTFGGAHEKAYFHNEKTFLDTPLGRKVAAIADAHYATIKDKWEVGCMGSAPAGSPSGSWSVSVYRVGDQARASFIHPEYPPHIFDTLPPGTKIKMPDGTEITAGDPSTRPRPFTADAAANEIPAPGLTEAEAAEAFILAL